MAVNAPDNYFGKCLQSFDDCLFGGFGLESPCQIIWIDSDYSKQKLDCKMLAEYYQDILEASDYLNEEGFEEGKERVLETIKSARKGEISMYDVIIETINSVSERASWPHKVKLILE